MMISLHELKNIKHTFEPQGWQDYALIPWWALRWLFAYVWWYLASTKKQLAGIEKRWSFMFSRHDDPMPIICPRCLWAGPRRWATHTYHGVFDSEVEAADECPRCGWEI